MFQFWTNIFVSHTLENQGGFQISRNALRKKIAKVVLDRSVRGFVVFGDVIPVVEPCFSL